MNVNDKVDQYFKLQQEIYDSVGYKENWRVFPLDDQREHHWMLIDNEVMVWSPEPFTAESIEAGTNVYSGNIYTQRFLNQWIYRSEELTLAIVDTQTDGNIFMMVFDTAKECTNPDIKELWSESW